MYNPTRRNRNIGTAKQGHGTNNNLVIPYSCIISKEYYENLGKYSVEERNINGVEFKFVIEQTRDGSLHTCSISDVADILHRIPKNDLKGLNLIIFKQTTRKEELLNEAWGRLVYSYKFDENYQPAIILNSVDLENSLIIPKKMSIDAQSEFLRLKKDGHEFIETKRHYKAELKAEYCRNTQLFRTLPHEVGHYVHYIRQVLNPLKGYDFLSDEYHEKEEELEKLYFSIPQSEKEVFANNYAKSINLPTLE
jgi:hypothetical protein